MMMLPLAFLLAGPLADNVFEPAVGQAGWEQVAPLVGNGVGAGIGLMLLIAGMGNAFLTLLVYLLPAIRRIEADLPDYVPAESPVSASPVMETSAV